ncbi:MAG: hypothetical protein J0M33_27055 [Anaerolineae bacterium]|nr:hypothetical protein [Anaerolineae bacterium]
MANLSACASGLKASHLQYLGVPRIVGVAEVSIRELVSVPIEIVGQVERVTEQRAIGRLDRTIMDMPQVVKCC